MKQNLDTVKSNCI